MNSLGQKIGISYHDRMLLMFRNWKCREVELMARLKGSPFIVDLVGAWEQSGFLYIQMPYYPMGNLASYLDANPPETLSTSFVQNMIADLVLVFLNG